MNYFRIRLRVVSAIGTPLAADTLFGHLCWSIAYGNGGEAELEDFLRRMDGNQPPLLISDPFPLGMMPVPILPSMPQHLWRDKPTLEQDRMKDLRKTTFLPVSDLFSCLANLNPERLFSTLDAAVKKNGKTVDETLSSALVSHNHVNRFGSGTIKGGIFFQEEIFVDAIKGMPYDCYVASSEYAVDEIRRMFVQALQGGYGRDKSTGRGVIDVLEIETWSPPIVKKPNAVMLLGPCVPAANDPTDGYWKIKAKAGRLGGHWAITENPFKKTIMMLQSGSVLKSEMPKPFYGRMITGAHPDLPQVRHYGLALALPLHLDPDSTGGEAA